MTSDIAKSEIEQLDILDTKYHTENLPRGYTFVDAYQTTSRVGFPVRVAEIFFMLQQREHKELINVVKNLVTTLEGTCTSDVNGHTINHQHNLFDETDKNLLNKAYEHLKEMEKR